MRGYWGGLIDIVGIGELLDCETIKVLTMDGDETGGEGLVFVRLG